MYFYSRLAFHEEESSTRKKDISAPPPLLLYSTWEQHCAVSYQPSTPTFPRGTVEEGGKHGEPVRGT